MSVKFDTIFESTISRFTNGGFLTGDLVTFKKNAFAHPAFEHDTEMQAMVRTLQDSGHNLRVTNIINRYPAVGGSGTDDYVNPRGRMATVSQEIAPGRYYNKVTVPLDVLDRHDTYPNLPPIPAKFNYNDRSHIEPRVVGQTKSDDGMLDPHRQTQTSDTGDGKDSEGDRKLPTKNTKIPAKPAVGQSDPAKVVTSYLPKEERGRRRRR